MQPNLISEAIEIVGLGQLAAGCDVTYQALRKWEKNGRLPRTEWTGETDYASVFERLTDGVITRARLLEMPIHGASPQAEGLVP